MKNIVLLSAIAGIAMGCSRAPDPETARLREEVRALRADVDRLDKVALNLAGALTNAVTMLDNQRRINQILAEKIEARNGRPLPP